MGKRRHLGISGGDLLLFVVVLVLLLLLLFGGLGLSLLGGDALLLLLILEVLLDLLNGGLMVLEGEFDDLLGSEWRPLAGWIPSGKELLLLVLHVLEVGQLDLPELVGQGGIPAEVLVVLELGRLQLLGGPVPVGELDKPPEGVHIGLSVPRLEDVELEVLAVDQVLDDVLEEGMEPRNIVAKAGQNRHFKVFVLVESLSVEQALELAVSVEHDSCCVKVRGARSLDQFVTFGPMNLSKLGVEEIVFVHGAP